MKHAEIVKILKFCKENGIKRIKTDVIEAEFYPIIQADSPIIEPKVNAPLSDMEEAPTEDEMLYASTPYFDELRAQRKAATQ